MARRLVLVLVIAASGCTWPWDEFRLQETDAGGSSTDAGGVDAALTDAGPARDAGPMTPDAGSCEGALVERCAPASQLCVRPAAEGGACCELGRCLDHEQRLRGWALRSAVTLGGPDGSTLEPEWGATPRYPLTSARTEGESAPQASDFAGSFRALWDGNQMQLFIEGTDDAIEHGMGMGTWQQVDSVEIFIDVNPAAPPPDTRFDPDETHFVIRLDGGARREHLDGEEWVMLFSRVTLDEPSGAWTIEISLHWMESGFRLPAPGDVVGIEVIAHDVDAFGGPSDDWSWSPCTELDPPSRLGLLALAGPGPHELGDCGRTCPNGLCAPAGYACDASPPQHCGP